MSGTPRADVGRSSAGRRSVIDDVSQGYLAESVGRGGQLTAPPVVCRRMAPLFSGRINDAFIALNMSAPLNASAVRRHVS